MTEMIAKTFYGLEDVLAEELHQLKANNIRTYNRAVGFDADKKMLYRANYCLRTALKVLVPLSESEIKNESDLYQFVRSVKWVDYMSVNDTLAVDVSLNTTLFRHSQFIAQKIKDAIVDQFRDKYGARPSVDLKNPTLKVNAVINNNIIKLSLDSSGFPLYRRGYRLRQGPAPVNEVLAAGLIRLSRWDKNHPFIDFMCGSGTIPVEAAMVANNVYPGHLRKEYGFQKWKDYDTDLFRELVKELGNSGNSRSARIFASDISSDSVLLAKTHAKNAGVDHKIQFTVSNFKNVKVPSPPGTLVINPPYGERISQPHLNDLYAEIGSKFKKDCAGYNAWVLSGNMEAMKHIGLKPSVKIPTYNGQLECRFNNYLMYEGSKKQKNK